MCYTKNNNNAVSLPEVYRNIYITGSESQWLWLLESWIVQKEKKEPQKRLTVVSFGFLLRRHIFSQRRVTDGERVQWQPRSASSQRRERRFRGLSPPLPLVYVLAPEDFVKHPVENVKKQERQREAGSGNGVDPLGPVDEELPHLLVGFRRGLLRRLGRAVGGFCDDPVFPQIAGSLCAGAETQSAVLHAFLLRRETEKVFRQVQWNAAFRAGLPNSVPGDLPLRRFSFQPFAHMTTNSEGSLAIEWGGLCWVSPGTGLGSPALGHHF